jgi:hypothetical protein
MGGPHSGQTVMEKFRRMPQILQPIIDLRLFKPVVWLYQPIALSNTSLISHQQFEAYFELLPKLAPLMLEGSDRQGALFRQFPNRVEIYRSLTDTIEFDEVAGDDSVMQKDIAATAYDAQIFIFKSVEYEFHLPREERKANKAYLKMKLKDAAHLARMCRAGRTVTFVGVGLNSADHPIFAL